VGGFYWRHKKTQTLRLLLFLKKNILISKKKTFKKSTKRAFLMNPRDPVNRAVKKNKGEQTLEETLFWSYEKNRILPFIEALKAGADPNARREDGTPLLNLVCARGSVCFAQALLDHKANPNIQDPAGETPLHTSFNREGPVLAKLLLRHGADPRITDMSGMTPLGNACEYYWNEISSHTIADLIEHGADINFGKKNEVDGLETPLAIACRNAMFSTVCNLLAAGADPNIEQREPPLFLAIATYMDCTPLLAAGADVNASTTDGRTALSMASENADIENVIRLVEHGALVNTTDVHGLSPLAYACCRLRKKTVEYLVQKGALVNQLDFLSLNPAYYIYSDRIPALVCDYTDHRICEHGGEDQLETKASILQILFASGADLPSKADLRPVHLREISKREREREHKKRSYFFLFKHRHLQDANICAVPECLLRCYY
jgi:ankyrin repeat protein